MSDADAIRAQVEEILDAHGLQYTISYVGKTQRDGWECDMWRATLGNEVFEYFTGLGLRRGPKGQRCPFPPGTTGAADWNRRFLRPVTPHIADVLYSVLSDTEAIEMSFLDWCDTFGFDTDSRKAERIYHACCDIGRKIRACIPLDAREELRKALQDY